VDQAYSLAGYRYTGTLQWRFNAASVPAGLPVDEVLAIVQRAFDNVTDARNLCGRPDDVTASARYLGTTNAAACPERHFRNFSVVGFGPLDDGDLAFMCPWTYRDETRLLVTDIIINSNEQWALPLASCTGDQVMLEAVMTHEVGHAFGLDHVRQRRHPDLTMRPRIGPCDNGPSTLGLGDVLGLEELYGAATP